MTHTRDGQEARNPRADRERTKAAGDRRGSWIGSGRIQRVDWPHVQPRSSTTASGRKSTSSRPRSRCDRPGLRQLLLRPAGAPVGILFARRDFLSAFISCFLPIIIVYYPLTLAGVNLGKDGMVQPDGRPLGRQCPAGRPRRVRPAPGHQALNAARADRGAAPIAAPAHGLRRSDDEDPRSRAYWAFFKAYIICFIALVGLYIVIDAFSNLDEFTEAGRRARSRCSRSWAGIYLIHMARSTTGSAA